MDSYEVERIVESAVRGVRSDLEHEIYMLQREFEREISSVRSSLDDARSEINHLELVLGDVRRTQEAHQEAWAQLGRAGQGL